MGVESTTANFVASGFGDIPLLKPPQQRAYDHNRTSQSAAFGLEEFGLKKIEVDPIRLKAIDSLGFFLDRHPEIGQQFDELIDVVNVGNILYFNDFVGQQHRANHLKRFVLGALRFNGSSEFAPPFDSKRSHRGSVIMIRCPDTFYTSSAVAASSCCWDARACADRCLARAIAPPRPGCSPVECCRCA